MAQQQERVLEWRALAQQELVLQAPVLQMGQPQERVQEWRALAQQELALQALVLQMGQQQALALPALASAETLRGAFQRDERPPAAVRHRALPARQDPR